MVENFSLREALKLINKPDLDFLTACSRTLTAKSEDVITAEIETRTYRQTFRRVVIQTVLGTDMSRHIDILGHFNTRVVCDQDLQNFSTGKEKWQAMTEPQQVLTLQMALKVMRYAVLELLALIPLFLTRRPCCSWRTLATASPRSSNTRLGFSGCRMRCLHR